MPIRSRPGARHLAGPAASVVVVVVAVVLSGCGGDGGSAATPVRGAPRAASSAGVTTRTEPPSEPTLSTAAWTLPRPSARAVLVPAGGDLLLLGGLDGSRQTTAEVLRLSPRLGRVTPAGTLAVALHDAAGAVVAGRPTVFGGGNASESATVQAVGPDGTATVIGHLPIARSDLGAATVGARTFLVGGYDGASIRATALATTDGATFQLLGDLPVPVRYAAVAALGADVYVIGGTAATGAVRTVQVLDTATGVTRVAGTLPATLSDAVAATVGGRLYVFGGRWDGQLSARVWRLDPAPTPTLVPVATLPSPVADAAVAVVGGAAYLVGGESPALLTTVSVLALP